MAVAVRLLILVIFALAQFATAKVDDAKCDAQLDYFDRALASRDLWAIERECCQEPANYFKFITMR
jgi:hypothetical protein